MAAPDADTAVSQAGLRDVAAALADLARDGWDLVLTHGSGPQVGQLLLASESGVGLRYGLDVVDAQTQGALGYLVQQAVAAALAEAAHPRPVTTVITQVVIDPDDPALKKPAKPIGRRYDLAQAEKLRRERGYLMGPDPRGGYRRLVASPRPLEIVEQPAIAALRAAGIIVIAVGGGGIPVARGADGRLRGVEAVVEKDHAAALLASSVDADALIVLTDVAEAVEGFGSASPRPLRQLPVAEARRLLAAGVFPAGSMGPKVEACAWFAERTGKRAVITSPPRVRDALAGRAGTTVTP